VEEEAAVLALVDLQGRRRVVGGRNLAGPELRTGCARAYRVFVDAV
jgi:hypothetical protein